MKVSVNWVKWYSDIDLPPIDELVTKIGAQLGAVEEVIDIGAKYKGIVVAKVVSCEKHPNADKLNVCAIDDGGNTPDVNRDENGHIQVVCGAPNVREGLLVAWIPPNVVVPSTYDTSDPFTLEARELRGVVSNGMLASGKELVINEDHDGILEVDEDVAPGTPFAAVYGLDDYIIDIENKMFTHRPDCFGQLGVAREIAGILGQKFISPDWYLQSPKNTAEQAGELLPLEVRNEIPELVPRFMTVAMSGIEIKPSPLWLQSYLSRVGIRPINNVVDVTNYMMMLTAQPLHAYDYDKVKAIDSGDKAILVVRKPKSGEKLTLLNDKEIQPRDDAIMIASATRAIGLGGVMGGADTEVDENTKNIILECANFDMYSIRRTSMAHGLFTDAVTRFNKGQNALQNDRVIGKSMQMIAELAGGKIASEVSDENGEIHASAKIAVTPGFINARLGLDLGGIEISNLLKNVEFIFPQVGGDSKEASLEVTVPFWRTDIKIPEDIVEEVGRLYGYDKLPLKLPQRLMIPTQRNALLETKTRIRDILSGAGANEVLTYSFVHSNLLEKVGQNIELAFQINNALSPDLQYYRLSLTPSLLEKVHPNIKAGYSEFALFEIGRAHSIGEQDPYEPDIPKEVNALSFVYAAKNPGHGAAYFKAKHTLSHLLANFNVDHYVGFEPLKNADLYNNPWIEQMAALFEPERSAVLRDKEGMIWGVVGEYKANVRKNLKLPEYVAGFEIDPLLMFLHNKTLFQYQPLPRFPKVMQDITLKVPTELLHAELFRFVSDYLTKHKPNHVICNVASKDIYQKENDPAYKHVTFGITMASYEKTMRDEEVTTLLNGLADEAKQRLGATRV